MTIGKKSLTPMTTITGKKIAVNFAPTDKQYGDVDGVNFDPAMTTSTGMTM